MYKYSVLYAESVKRRNYFVLRQVGWRFFGPLCSRKLLVLFLLFKRGFPSAIQK